MGGACDAATHKVSDFCSKPPPLAAKKQAERFVYLTMISPITQLMAPATNTKARKNPARA